MAKTVVLYGAAGFSGQLIARTLLPRWRKSPSMLRLELAGRHVAALQELSRQLRQEFDLAADIPCRAFALDQADELRRGVEGAFGVINAAGPFAFTAEPLAKAALRAGAHYLDIAGEVDVYKALDDLGYVARQRGLTMVCGAGHTATVSDVMLNAALQELYDQGYRELGAIRIALSHVRDASRGSVTSAWRAAREQVVVVRDGGLSDHPPKGRKNFHDLRLVHLPVGQLERSFVFEAEDRRGDSGEAPPKPPQKRIASAVNLIDTLTARLTAARRMDRVQTIESYLEMPGSGRIALQWGALVAPLLSFPGVRGLVQRQMDILPDGPSEAERQRARHQVVLEIDDQFGQPIVEWCMDTPNPYDVTARCVMTIVEKLAEKSFPGWRTPAEILDISAAELRDLLKWIAPLNNCRLIDRSQVAA